MSSRDLLSELLFLGWPCTQQLFSLSFCFVLFYSSQKKTWLRYCCLWNELVLLDLLGLSHADLKTDCCSLLVAREKCYSLTGWRMVAGNWSQRECCIENFFVITLVDSRLPVVCVEDADLSVNTWYLLWRAVVTLANASQTRSGECSLLCKSCTITIPDIETAQP